MFRLAFPGSRRDRPPAATRDSSRKTMKIRIVPMSTRHVEEVTAVHLRAFPRFFLSFLGARFLRLFYGCVVREPSAFGVVALPENSEDVLGFVAGTDAPRGFFKRLLRSRLFGFALASVGPFLRRPSIAPRLLRALLYRGDSPPGEGRALLMSIAVDPEAQGRGVGKLLIDAWVLAARARGAKGLYLATDAVDNDATNGFYLKNGWRVESTYQTPEGRLMYRYVLDLD